MPMLDGEFKHADFLRDSKVLGILDAPRAALPVQIYWALCQMEGWTVAGFKVSLLELSAGLEADYQV